MKTNRVAREDIADSDPALGSGWSEWKDASSDTAAVDNGAISHSLPTDEGLYEWGIFEPGQLDKVIPIYLGKAEGAEGLQGRLKAYGQPSRTHKGHIMQGAHDAGYRMAVRHRKVYGVETRSTTTEKRAKEEETRLLAAIDYAANLQENGKSKSRQPKGVVTGILDFVGIETRHRAEKKILAENKARLSPSNKEEPNSGPVRGNSTGPARRPSSASLTGGSSSSPFSSSSSSPGRSSSSSSPGSSSSSSAKRGTSDAESNKSSPPRKKDADAESGPKTKSGELDMRYKVNREAVAAKAEPAPAAPSSLFSRFFSPSSSSARRSSSGAEAGSKTKSGEPDMRYKANREAAAQIKAPAEAPRPSTASRAAPAPSYEAPRTKSGELDMRYAANKAARERETMAMRAAVARAEASRHYSPGSRGGGGGMMMGFSSPGPVTAAGRPDMRYAVNKRMYG